MWNVNDMWIILSQERLSYMLSTYCMNRLWQFNIFQRLRKFNASYKFSQFKTLLVITHKTQSLEHDGGKWDGNDPCEMTWKIVNKKMQEWSVISDAGSDMSSLHLACKHKNVSFCIFEIYHCHIKNWFI